MFLRRDIKPRPTRERRAGRVSAHTTIVLRRYYVGNGLDRSEKTHLIRVYCGSKLREARQEWKVFAKRKAQPPYVIFAAR